MATIINNVFFAYTKLKAPVQAIKKTNTEVSVQVVMSEDEADNLLEVCPSANVKSYKNEVFAEKFKFDAPFADQKKQFVVSFKKMVSKDGVDLPENFRPRVFHLQEDGSKEDITFEKEVGNGSLGSVAYSTYKAKYIEDDKEVVKTLCQLVAIQVEDLIEYISERADEGDGGDTEDSLPANVFGGGNTKLAEAPKNQKAVVKQSEAAPAKTTTKPESKVVDTTDDCPF